jgi:4-amino-4-deoxy-L-arabinose transferase-like glycosyltransferase
MKKFRVEEGKILLADLLPSNRFYVLALVSILFISFGLRLTGISWGLPDETHRLSYHPDERNILYAITNLNPGDLDFNPNYFYYPTFHVYLYFTILLFTGAQTSQLATIILIGRIVTLFFGTLSVYVIYLLGKEFFGDEIGLIASTLLGIVPLHVIHSHFLTTDVPVTFWLLTSMLFCFKLLNSGGKKWYLLAGFTGGLAVATKYNAGLIIIPILTAHILNRLTAKVGLSVLLDKRISLAYILIISTFILTSPYTIIAFSEFKYHLTLITSYLNTPNAEWFDSGNGWIYHITNSLYFGMGLPLLAFSFFGLLISVWKEKEKSLIILSFIIPYFLWVGNWQARFARFILPIVPFLILLTSYGLYYLWIKHRRGGTLIFLSILLYTAILTVAYSQTMATPDPRDQAHTWIKDNISKNSTIGLLPTFQSTFQFFTPPLIGYDLILTLNSSDLKEMNVGYFILSELDYRVYLKTKKTKEKYYLESEFLNYLFNGSDYRVIKVFKNDHKFLFIDLTNEYLPHDMIYANPEIIIFERVKQ